MPSTRKRSDLPAKTDTPAAKAKKRQPGQPASEVLRLSHGVLSPELRRFFDSMTSHFPGHVMQRVMQKDGAVRYTYVSPGVTALGLDAEAILKATPSPQDWIHPDDAARWRAALSRSAEALETLDEEVRVIGLDGRVRWVRSIGNPRLLGNGDVVWDGIALDVTDKREALDAIRLTKAEAVKAEARKARLLASLSAVLEEPGRLLKGWIEAADEHAHGNAAMAKLKQAAQAIEQALALLHGQAEPDTTERISAAQEKAISGLSARQREILTLLGDGQSNREIAERLGLTEGTVKLHVAAVLRGLGVSNRTQAALALRTSRQLAP